MVELDRERVLGHVIGDGAAGVIAPEDDVLAATVITPVALTRR